MEYTPGFVAQIHVKVFDGNDTTPGWTFVDGNNASHGLNKVSASQAGHPQLVLFNSKLYNVWVEQVGGAENVMVAVGN